MHAYVPPSLAECEATIRPILDRHAEAIDKTLQRGGITVLIGRPLSTGMLVQLAALGWDGRSPVFRISQSRGVRLVDEFHDCAKTHGLPPDPLFVEWLEDRRADRVWVFTQGANFICRRAEGKVALVPGSTDIERAAQGISPVYLDVVIEEVDDTLRGRLVKRNAVSASVNSPGGVG